MKNKNRMLYVGGKKEPYYCEVCGANVFTEKSKMKYECNGCGTGYEGTSPKTGKEAK